MSWRSAAEPENYISAIHAKTGCTATGIDPSTEMLATLRGRETPVQVIVGRAEKLDLPSSSVDLVFSVDVIHHVHDRAEAYREAFRVLRDGGRICTVTDSEWTLRHREPHAAYFPETIEIELARYPTLATLRSEMATARFDAVEEELVECFLRSHRRQPLSSQDPFCLALPWRGGVPARLGSP
jgi:SAM-dependent methyltransferase